VHVALHSWALLHLPGILSFKVTTVLSLSHCYRVLAKWLFFGGLGLELLQSRCCTA
jgi:hypothetical protein